MLEILLKFEIFDHPGDAKHAIWQNLENWVTLEMFLKFEIFDHPGHAKHEIWQNQEIWVM